MNRQKRDETGFSLVEALIIVVVVALLGVGGWWVYMNNNKPASKASTTTDSSSQTTDAYAGWKTGTLQYEKIGYKYPSDWAVTDTSLAQGPDDCVTPGDDHVVLTSPSKHQVSLRTGVDCIGDDGVKPFDAIALKSLGQSVYLAFDNYYGNGDTPTAPAFACLAQTATPGNLSLGASKYITAKLSTPYNSFCYYPFEVGTTSTIPTSTVSDLKSSADFATAKLIFESLQYK